MTLCGEASIVNHGPDHSRAVTLRCRSWGCPHCHDMRVRQLVKEIINGHPERLLTLTMRSGSEPTPELQAQALSRHFRTLMQWIRECWWDVDHQYFAVFEAHKSGWPHLHIAMRGCFLPWKTLRDWWEAISGSPGVDIRFIHDPRDCAAYVAKYMGKDTHRYEGTKRYWKSQGWQLVWDDEYERDDRFGGVFWIVPVQLADLAEQWSRRYRHVWWEQEVLVRGREPPPDVLEARRAIDALVAA